MRREISLSPGAKSAASKGVKIVFSDASGANKTLYYFATNLADDSIGRTGFLQFCAKLGPADSFIKSASYLLQTGRFNKVRNFLLEQSATVLQDDTGIPIAYFNPKVWRFQAFGRYVGPLNISGATYQARMGELFRNAIPIDFGVGYRWRINESNLVLAEKVAYGSERQRVSTSFTIGPIPSCKRGSSRSKVGSSRRPGNRRQSEPRTEPRGVLGLRDSRQSSRFVLTPRLKLASNASKWGHSRRGNWALVGDGDIAYYGPRTKAAGAAQAARWAGRGCARASFCFRIQRRAGLNIPAPRIAAGVQARSRALALPQSPTASLQRRIALLRAATAA